MLDSSCFDCGKPHGKPTVVGSTLEVSISHSGDWVALAVTDGAPVGVDVEEVRAAEVDDLAGICFSPAELAVFRRVPEADRRGAFFTYWARKEAVLKATGKGMSVGMSKLTLTAHDEPPRVVASEAAEVDIPTAHMTDLDRARRTAPAWRCSRDTPRSNGTRRDPGTESPGLTAHPVSNPQTRESIVQTQ